MEKNENSLDSTSRVGFWSAILTAALAAAFFGIGLFGSSYTEGVKYPYVLTTIRPVDYVVWIPAFLLAPTFVVLLACIHTQTREDKKVFSLVGLSFGIMYAALVVSDFFIQWTVVLPSILTDETNGLSLFSMYNPHGITLAIESLGYLVMDTALLFLAAVFDGKNRLERATRWLFIGGFISTVISFAVLSAAGNPIVVFEVVAVTINVIVLIVAGALLGFFFMRISSFHHDRVEIDST